MGEGSLSQDEIDALLQGAEDSPFDVGGGSVSSSGGAADSLSPIDRDIISDMLGQAFQTAGNVLGTILAKNTRFNNPSTESRTWQKLAKSLAIKQYASIHKCKVHLVDELQSSSPRRMLQKLLVL